jgi:hypothetical protein
LKHIRARAVWFAIGLVLGGGALSYAGVAAIPSKKPTPHVTSTKDKPEVKADEKNEKNEKSEKKEKDEQGGPRKHNHGYWVSLAAQCKDVTDTEDGLTFKAPSDCKTNGSAHGEYVSTVARSDAGKKSHPNHGNPTGTGGPNKG